MVTDRRRIARLREERRRELEERRRGKAKHSIGHFFIEDDIEDDIEDGIDPADSAADAEERELAEHRGKAAEPPSRLSSSELRLALWTWDLKTLGQLWNERAEKLTSLEDAARLLAHLRHRSGIDPQLRSASEVIRYDAIEALRGTLEDAGRWITAAEAPEPPSSETGKRVEQVLRVIREGQADFRKRLVSYYGARCMVTGTCHPAVIDAAHIAPYNGISTNSLSNGVLLRKDIHALFDSGLLQIDQNLVVGVSSELMDDHYRALHGKGLKLGVPSKISASALRDRAQGKMSSDLKSRA